MKHRWTKLGVGMIFALAVVSASPVYALTASAVDDWASRFAGAAASGSADEIFDRLNEVRDERLPLDGLKKVLTSFIGTVNITSAGPFQYTSKIETDTVGDIYSKFTTAVVYKNTHLYYTTTFIRSLQGWQLISIHLDTDINKVKALPWPQ